MPEGHIIHRLAKVFNNHFVSQMVSVSSPQGRFTAGAEILDGLEMVSAEAYGKQLFLCFKKSGPLGANGMPIWLRIHLGLYGGWRFAGLGLEEQGRREATVKRVLDRDSIRRANKNKIGNMSDGMKHISLDENSDLADRSARSARISEDSAVAAHLLANHETDVDTRADDGSKDAAWPPAPRGLVRLRLLAGNGVADLSGPTACVLETPAGKAAALARLGEDPLRDDADCDAAGKAIRSSRSAVGLLLMRQDLVAGVGNIYRAEVLFRIGINPHRPGREITKIQWLALWTDLRGLMQDGVEQGRSITTRPEHRASGQQGGAVRRGDASYVAHRAGQPCRVCDMPVRVEMMAGRTLYWCEVCQP